MIWLFACEEPPAPVVAPLAAQPRIPVPTPSPARKAPPLYDPPPSGWPVEPDAPGCPTGMARVDDFCIHRFELHVEGRPHAGDTTLRSEPGLLPKSAITWTQSADACRRAGFHLCTSTEWERACAGEEGRPYPSGSTWAGCNVAHPVDGHLHATGRNPGCRTPEGVYDLIGNLWEWTDPQQTRDGEAVIDKRGAGYYSGDAATCQKAAVGSHTPHFEGTIGFRCCAPVKP